MTITESKKKIIITGSTGMLGKDVYATLKSSGYNVYGVARNKGDFSDYSVDLTNKKQVMDFLDKIQPEIIIHCAAKTNVNDCDLNRENAYLVNVEATKILDSYGNNKRFIYISTDSVFDGHRGDFDEEDKTNPLNYYAYTKVQGEKIVLENNKNSVILRTNIYGYHINKGTSLFEWAFDNLKENKEINGFNDMYFNPLYTKQLAKIIEVLVDNGSFTGILNVGSNKKISKYDFIRKIAEKFNLDTSLIKAKSVDEFEFKTQRPKDTTLNISKFNNIFSMDFSIDEGINCLFDDYNMFSN